MTYFLRALSDHITLVVQIGAGLVAIIGFRKYIWGFFLRMHRCVTRPARIDKALESFPQMIEDLAAIKKAIFNGGADGILQSVEILTAQANADFESAHVPKCICDNRGGNVRVNLAYRKLVEVWRDDDIHGTQWMGVIHGSLRDSYIAEFVRCAATGEDFFGDVDFHNPATNEHRGRWKINAPATLRGDGSSIYVGTFTVALDQAAARLATENAWIVKIAEN